jgi:hypothetical protein
MSNSQRKPVQRPRLASIATAVLLTLILVVFVTVGSSALPPGTQGPTESGNEGPWINSALSYNCESGNVCAEWPFWDTNTATVCCIEGSMIGSYTKEFSTTCYTNFGERAR